MKIYDAEIDMDELATPEGLDKAAKMIAEKFFEKIPDEEKAKVIEGLKEKLSDLSGNKLLLKQLGEASSWLEKTSDRLRGLAAALIGMAQTLDSPPQIYDFGGWNNALTFAAGMLHVSADNMKDFIEKYGENEAAAPTEPPPPEPQPDATLS